MSKLAIHGGPKIRTKLFPSQNTYDHEEMEAVQKVMKSGRLSWYRGNWGPEFYGGPEIQALEQEWKEKFHVKHAICCNSATSGLFIAMGALGLEKGDNVIVTPYSMTCSATIPLAWGLKPVFADIERDKFCLDYESVKSLIKPNQKPGAIIAVSLFGQPFDPRLREFGILIIEDAAQALGGGIYQSSVSFHNNLITEEEYLVRKHQAGLYLNTNIKYAGTIGDIGVYSFNYGKHITCGEGGMIVTDDDDLALRCRLIMNHGESVTNDIFNTAHTGIREVTKAKAIFLPGFNLRMTEIQASIIRVQLRKLNRLIEQRRTNAILLQERLFGIPAISISPVRENCTHTYYALPFLWNQDKAEGLHRDTFINAVKAELTPRQDRDGEGIQIGCGYIRPIYRMPIFSSDIRLPNVESLWKDELFLTLYHAPNSTITDMQDISDAFCKVWENRDELRKP